MNPIPNMLKTDRAFLKTAVLKVADYDFGDGEALDDQALKGLSVLVDMAKNLRKFGGFASDKQANYAAALIERNFLDLFVEVIKKDKVEREAHVARSEVAMMTNPKWGMF